MTTASEELYIARNAYAGATRKAARVNNLLTLLSKQCVWLNFKEVTHKVASSYFFRSDSAAYERYDSVEDFANDLREDLIKDFTVDIIDGVEMLCIKPFLATTNGSLLREMGLGYLKLAFDDKFESLKVAAVAPSERTIVSGISDIELQTLASVYLRDALKIVNAMRELRTALHYVQKGLVNVHNVAPAYPGALKDEDIETLVNELVSEVTMPFEPAPAGHFSSDSDRTNNLKYLNDPQSLAWLMAVSV